MEINLPESHFRGPYYLQFIGNGLMPPALPKCKNCSTLCKYCHRRHQATAFQIRPFHSFFLLSKDSALLRMLVIIAPTTMNERVDFDLTIFVGGTLGILFVGLRDSTEQGKFEESHMPSPTSCIISTLGQRLFLSARQPVGAAVKQKPPTRISCEGGHGARRTWRGTLCEGRQIHPLAFPVQTAAAVRFFFWQPPAIQIGRGSALPHVFWAMTNQPATPRNLPTRISESLRLDTRGEILWPSLRLRVLGSAGSVELEGQAETVASHFEDLKSTTQN